ncbi:hypothetical protein B0T13DRAFT_474235 [Neurospora crassa]|nr:hypothetical protein B0T13DRAFT_474235 [Neurospora crassa]
MLRMPTIHISSLSSLISVQAIPSCPQHRARDVHGFFFLLFQLVLDEIRKTSCIAGIYLYLADRQVSIRVFRYGIIQQALDKLCIATE